MRPREDSSSPRNVRARSDGGISASSQEEGEQRPSLSFETIRRDLIARMDPSRVYMTAVALNERISQLRDQLTGPLEDGGVESLCVVYQLGNHQPL